MTAERRRGRGSATNRSGRFEPLERSGYDDGWQSLGLLEPLQTDVTLEAARQIITSNNSPDISFDRSINPYRGCEHGCSYCYARPTHTYMGLSAGLDFETRLFAKPNAAELLKKELAAPGYRAKTIALGTNTDPYQPIERRYKLTRQILEVLAACDHPVGIVTKSALVVRDLDILSRMAEKRLVKVALSVTTLDRQLSRTMEPRAAAPGKRLEALELLKRAGVPTAVMMAPIIPAINDAEIEAILGRARAVGASEAGYVLLRLPLELRALFREWLEENFADRAGKVMKLVRDTRGGADYESRWGLRQRGRGPYADQIAARFRLAAQREGLNARRLVLRTDLFRPPVLPGQQLSLI